MLRPVQAYPPASSVGTQWEGRLTAGRDSRAREGEPRGGSPLSRRVGPRLHLACACTGACARTVEGVADDGGQRSRDGGAGELLPERDILALRACREERAW